MTTLNQNPVLGDTVRDITGYRWGAGSKSTWPGITAFDTSRSSAVYGRGNTTEVRPVNHSVYWYIKI